jgi:hypothetical protein
VLACSVQNATLVGPRALKRFSHFPINLFIAFLSNMRSFYVLESCSFTRLLPIEGKRVNEGKRNGKRGVNEGGFSLGEGVNGNFNSRVNEIVL